ncbi:LPS export ABC transporter periplasmic protein LptC [Candidatus Palibaumannia cicadellinicola]|uniref:LPS export ABC transporter periplasmic protein LptC n=1 Tax=Candidatus Palibaumannia cicadellinicola TaxID=186490 RepID=UPI00130ECCA4|nr:LPS export ABC transporter periplasmic protein LptC [Candidatus Baumannia cicadellinicola]
MINLITQNILSDEETSLYGTNFYSTGMKMWVNLRKKTAELIDQVKTSDEINRSPHTLYYTHSTNKCASSISAHK